MRAGPSGGWSRIAASMAVLGLVALTAFRLTEVATWHLALFDLALERPGANTILLLRQGVPIYSPATYDAPPFNLTIYTPAYHYLVAALPAGPSPFTTGRVVSTVFMLLAAGTLFLAASGAPGRIAALGAAAFFLSLPVVTTYVMVARQDLLVAWSDAPMPARAGGGGIVAERSREGVASQPAMSAE